MSQNDLHLIYDNHKMICIMKKLLIKLGLIKHKEMTLDEYIISIRPKARELSRTTIKHTPSKTNHNNNEGPEEAGCLVTA